MIINIITPLTRPENLDAMWKSIRGADIEIIWWIVVDKNCHRFDEWPYCDLNKEAIYIHADSSALAGHAHRNLVLDITNGISDEWVMSLDDDNIIHPGLWDFLSQYNDFEKVDGLIWDQVSGCGSHRLIADPNKIHVHNVDTAQYMLKRSLIGDIRFQEDKYEADGLFIQDIYERNKDSFIIVNQPLCYYNYLRS